MRILDPEKYSKILEICASQEKVRGEVLKNHEDNMWWPRSIKDWRIRFLVAGLSARINYRMIKTYRRVIEKLKRYSYESIASMRREEFVFIIKPLGLTNLRVKFWQSTIKFIEKIEKEKIKISDFSNDELIRLIRREVEGADYHLAQCCALCLRDYYCGIIPVDSGMIRFLAPCLGFPLPKGSYAYEILRKELEELASKIDCLKIANTTGYQSMIFPKNKPLTWWMHLVLIYYKRVFCNNHDFNLCPLRKHPSIGEFIGRMCDRNHPQIGGVKNVIFEGIDGTGKTTMAKMFLTIGFKKIHAEYHPEIEDLYSFYDNLLEDLNNQRIVFDRSFISEMVYGPILRNKSRLSMRRLKNLLIKLKNQKTLLVYLYSPLEILLKRKGEESTLIKHYPELTRKYEKLIEIVKKFIPVVQVNSRKNYPKQIFHLICGFKFPEQL